jgi:hypothetical protein
MVVRLTVVRCGVPQNQPGPLKLFWVMDWLHERVMFGIHDSAVGTFGSLSKVFNTTYFSSHTELFKSLQTNASVGNCASQPKLDRYRWIKVDFSI